MTTSLDARTATVELPSPIGPYRGAFEGGVSIGAASATRIDEVMVWVDRGANELTAIESRRLATALLAAADAADAENRVLRGESARAELIRWNSTGPSEDLATDRALRLQPGDAVADLDGSFGIHAPGTVAWVDAAADEVTVTAWGKSEPVAYALADAGARLFLAGDRS